MHVASWVAPSFFFHFSKPLKTEKWQTFSIFFPGLHVTYFADWGEQFSNHAPTSPFPQSIYCPSFPLKWVADKPSPNRKNETLDTFARFRSSTKFISIDIAKRVHFFFRKETHKKSCVVKRRTLVVCEWKSKSVMNDNEIFQFFTTLSGKARAFEGENHGQAWTLPWWCNDGLYLMMTRYCTIAYSVTSVV